VNEPLDKLFLNSSASRRAGAVFAKYLDCTKVRRNWDSFWEPSTSS